MQPEIGRSLAVMSLMYHNFVRCNLPATSGNIYSTSVKVMHGSSAVLVHIILIKVMPSCNSLWGMKAWDD